MSISRPIEPVQHDPLVCGLGHCPGCEAEDRIAAIRENRRRQRQARLNAPITRRDVLRMIRRELRRELSPIIAHLREGK